MPAKSSALMIPAFLHPPRLHLHHHLHLLIFLRSSVVAEETVSEEEEEEASVLGGAFLTQA